MAVRERVVPPQIVCADVVVVDVVALSLSHPRCQDLHTALL